MILIGFFSFEDEGIDYAQGKSFLFFFLRGTFNSTWCSIAFSLLLFVEYFFFFLERKGNLNCATFLNKHLSYIKGI